MSDLQAIWKWMASHFDAMLFVARAHLHAALEWLEPPLRSAIGWIEGHFQGAVDWTAPALRSAVAAARPYGATALGYIAPYWLDAAILAAVVVTVVATVRSLRRQRSAKISLVDATLDRDPKTEWLKLGITVRNFQSHALVVHTLRVERPAEAQICEHWKAWQPIDGGVKFVAPDLVLTNAAEIERTILPYQTNGKRDAFGGIGSGRHDDDDSEITRSFYLRPPAETQRVTLRAVLVCELQARKGRTQEIEFQRTLELAAPGAVEPAVT